MSRLRMHRAGHLASPVCAIALVAAGAAVASPLFDSQEVLEVRLEGPLSSLIKDTEKQEEKPIALHNGDVAIDIEVRVRGRSRLRVCEFPLLRLDFPTDGVDGTVFAGQDKLKLVTHCRNYDRAEKDMLEEYAAYRIFNILQDSSYRVRPLRIHYDDTVGKLSRKAVRRFAFVIESAEDLAIRTGMQPVEVTDVARSKYDEAQAAIVYVFQYLIGNTDWSLVKADEDEFCCHNLDLYEKDGRLVMVPYDFDLAGIVNAQYAFPDSTLRISKVTQRLYRGICMDNAVLKVALQKVKSHREDILAVFDDVAGLAAYDLRSARNYIERFFELAENEDKLLRIFARRCI